MEALTAFAALSDPTRAQIVDALAGGPRSVNEIVALFSISQPSISRHLRVLREAGLISVKPQGRQRLYRLEPAPLRELDAWLARYRPLWVARLDSLERQLNDEDPA